MDTEDGVEELLTYTDLIKAVVDKGIKTKQWYYIEYGVDDAKDIIYKLINRARDELNLDFIFHSKFISKLPKLGQI